MVIGSILPEHRFSDYVSVLVVPLSVGCVALGGAFEATVTRIAKFDEVDFCNQSLGAVLAGLASLAILRGSKPSQWLFSFPLLIAGVFLCVGFYFALF